MKTSLIAAFMLIAAIASAQPSADDLFLSFPRPLRNTSSWSPFESVEGTAHSVVLRMKDHGIRWKAALNGTDQGITQYGQEFTLTTNDTLFLAEKHSHAFVRLLADGTNTGIGIILIGRPDYLAIVSSTNYFFHEIKGLSQPSASGYSQPADELLEPEP